MTLTFNSKNQNITIFKGDTGAITFRTKSPATYSTGDSISFLVKDKDGNILINKEVTEFINENKDAVVTFTKENTSVSGIYKYSVTYNTTGGQIMHIVPNLCDGTKPTFSICEG